jgi:hypothetical protein
MSGSSREAKQSAANLICSPGVSSANRNINISATELFIQAQSVCRLHKWGLVDDPQGQVDLSLNLLPIEASPSRACRNRTIDLDWQHSPTKVGKFRELFYF